MFNVEPEENMREFGVSPGWNPWYLRITCVTGDQSPLISLRFRSVINRESIVWSPPPRGAGMPQIWSQLVIWSNNSSSSLFQFRVQFLVESRIDSGSLLPLLTRLPLPLTDTWGRPDAGYHYTQDQDQDEEDWKGTHQLLTTMKILYTRQCGHSREEEITVHYRRRSRESVLFLCEPPTLLDAASLVICTLKHRPVAEYDVAVTCQWCSINA